MGILTSTLTTIKRHRLQFSLSVAVCLILLILLTTFTTLKLILQRSDTSDPIKFFTSEESQQLQYYFSQRIVVCSLTLFVLLLFVFLLRFHQRKIEATETKQVILMIGLECFLGLLAATICFILLFALFEPSYEELLQRIYHQGLKQFNNLPNFILSNGTSGIAYSIRSSLSFDLTSTSLFALFFHSLFHSIAFISGCLFLLVLLFQLTNYLQKRKNVR